MLRRFTTCETASRDWTYWIETGTQPALRGLWSHLVNDTLYWPVTRVLQRLDPLAERWHERTCHDDCSTMTTVATGVEHPACGRLPLDVRLDLYGYDVGQAGWQRTGWFEVSEYVWTALDRTQRS